MDAATAMHMAVHGLDAEHWTGLGRGVYLLPRCPDCRRWVWPVQPRCGVCGHVGMAWEAVPMEGAVYSWIRTWYPFVDERAGSLPYVTVLVELPAAGNVRVLGIYEGDDQRLRTSAAVTGRIAEPSEATFGLPSVVWS
jgi:uncharacterized OB-fold protein